jgi:hypothetical protein
MIFMVPPSQGTTPLTSDKYLIILGCESPFLPKYIRPSSNNLSYVALETPNTFPLEV